MHDFLKVHLKVYDNSGTRKFRSFLFPQLTFLDKWRAMNGFDINLKSFEGNALIASENASAQGVTTRVKIVATVNPTTSDAAICSQKLVI